MKEQSLFNLDNTRVAKIFTCKDFFYNNGIVNLYQFLQNKDFDITVSLHQNELILEFDAQKENEVYSQILNSFLKDNQIVHQTDNDRWYFDETKMDFIIDKRFNTKGGQKNDVRNGILKYIKPIISEKELFEKLQRFGERYDFDIFKKNQKLSYEPIFKKDGSLIKKEISLVKLISTEKAMESFEEYLSKNDILSIDSKIHSFEDGQDYFHDMLKQPQTYKIDKWNALMYWFGGRMKRFYNYSYFIYPNSSNLEALNTFKKFLQINDNKTIIRDKKTDTLKEIGTNINFYTVLKKDEINNENFYISKSAEEFEVKFFMYLFSVMYHIEEQYENANERRQAQRQELFDILQYMSFIIYTDDGTFKTSLNEYTKAYRLIQLFMKLKEESLFKYLGHVFQVFSMSQGNEINLNLQHWCQKILSFGNVRKEYFAASFSLLKNNSQGFGKELFAFEHSYLKNVLGGNEMRIHEDAKKIGDGVGFFCAELGDKDLLFKLRSVKNYKQLVSYFKDLKFSSLKHAEKARFSNEFNESLENLLVNVEQNWEIARDYIAIYAIDKFKTVSFAKSK